MINIKVNLKDSHGPYYIKKTIDSEMVNNLNPDEAKIASRRWKIAIDGAINAERPMPILRNIDATKTAILVIDMQNAFIDIGAAIEVPEGRSIVSNINKITSKIRDGGGLVIFFRYLVNENVGLLKHFEGKSYLGEGRESPMKALQSTHRQFQLYSKLDIRKNDIILDKIRYSAVLGSNVVQLLKRQKIENVIITGVTTDVCAGNTAEDLMQKDFFVVMIWDGTAALNRLEHELYLARIFGLYGDVMPAKEILARIK